MNALDILLPNAPAQPGPKYASANRLKTATQIEKASSRIFELVANHEFDHPDFQHLIADDYAAYQEFTDKPISKTREEFLANYKAYVEAHPDYAVQLLSVSADVNEKRGLATVWALIRIRGQPTNVWMESVTVGWFRRVGGHWSAYRQDGIRGMGWFSSEWGGGLDVYGWRSGPLNQPLLPNDLPQPPEEFLRKLRPP